METLQKVFLVAHTLIALGIIGLVLLQRGKGADAGAGFGSGASGTVFGARGSSSFFSRATAVLATAFFATSLVLAYISSQRTQGPDSLLEGAPVAEEQAPTPAEGSEQAPAAGAEQAPASEMPAVDDSAPETNGSADDLPELDDQKPAQDSQ
jgi:preprotein translocase subunit SecG